MNSSTSALTLATVHQRQLRGNLPQAFVHAGMLECAVRLSGQA